MANPFYLAMTAAEFSVCQNLPPNTAWMACHFSPYGTGLSNCPSQLPPGSLIILNDRIPPQGHDPAQISEALQALAELIHPDGFLLDFQRPNCEETGMITQMITSALSCPVAVSHHYAALANGPVFLPPPPIRQQPTAYFAPWKDREIWLEVWDQWETVTITKTDGQISNEIPLQSPPLPYQSKELCCAYGISDAENSITVTLHRNAAAICQLPCSATKFVGLWQEYHP